MMLSPDLGFYKQDQYESSCISFLWRCIFISLKKHLGIVLIVFQCLNIVAYLTLKETTKHSPKLYCLVLSGAMHESFNRSTLL